MSKGELTFADNKVQSSKVLCTVQEGPVQRVGVHPQSSCACCACCAVRCLVGAQVVERTSEQAQLDAVQEGNLQAAWGEAAQGALCRRCSCGRGCMEQAAGWARWVLGVLKGVEGISVFFASRGASITQAATCRAHAPLPFPTSLQARFSTFQVLFLQIPVKYG
jgi:hypothetical protein